MSTKEYDAMREDYMLRTIQKLAHILWYPVDREWDASTIEYVAEEVFDFVNEYPETLPDEVPIEEVRKVI